LEECAGKKKKQDENKLPAEKEKKKLPAKNTCAG
jgi:hypothetical protein